MQHRTAFLASKPLRPALPAVLFALYLTALLLLVGHKPLWLDEIWQQLGTRNVSFAQMTSYARQEAGGAFLPHFCQWLVLKFLPYSAALSRLPALLFGIGATVCFWFLARRLRLKSPEAALALFMVIPILFRYSLEARPYSQALFFCCWALLLLFQLDEQPSAKRSLLLLAVSAAILYSQPFAIFTVAVTAVALAVVSQRRTEKLLSLFLPVIASALLYLPWYLSASKHWSNGLSPAPASINVFDAKLPLRIVREYTGGGYVVGICLLLLLALGFYSSHRKRQAYALLAGFVGGLLFPLLAEEKLDYFYAARHILFALPAAILLAALVFDSNQTRLRLYGRVLFSIFVIASIASIAAKEAGRHENWQRTASTLSTLHSEGYCIVAAQPDGMTYYEFFQPALKDAGCRSGSQSVILVADPYTPPSLYNGKLRALESAGYQLTSQRQEDGFQMAALIRQSGAGR